MNQMLKDMYELFSIIGPSGKEEAVANYLEPRLVQLLDWVGRDEYGNLLGELKVGSGEGKAILLSAHMDTVDFLVPGRRIEVDGLIFRSTSAILGGDDRAGIAIVLEVLRQLKDSSFDGVIKVAFTREEEIGRVGSQQIPHKWLQEVELAIVADRKGSRDIVISCGDWYEFCDPEVGQFFERMGESIGMDDWRAVAGGISDAMTFASYGIPSVNLSAGYYNPHTDQEYVDAAACYKTVLLILEALEQSHSIPCVTAGNTLIGRI